MIIVDRYLWLQVFAYTVCMYNGHTDLENSIDFSAGQQQDSFCTCDYIKLEHIWLISLSAV